MLKNKNKTGRKSKRSGKDEEGEMGKGGGCVDAKDAGRCGPGGSRFATVLGQFNVQKLVPSVMGSRETPQSATATPTPLLQTVASHLKG
ncbi:hypothetical protein FNV43_RR01085 [Rhamnella rubrinervis]|uniref:Uncharacterized protein n=1 Tax=Rhamnella rubrinervis TaxID=2594499 RepID=A0A8K0HRM3_9ROSA|nr:hypothetical protein FNV43_RR01085 [Rhamnella rubrinervis]